MIARFGNTVLVHFEDMSYANLSRLFNQYRGSLACFSDDVQVCSLTAPSHLVHCALLPSLLASPVRKAFPCTC